MRRCTSYITAATLLSPFIARASSSSTTREISSDSNDKSDAYLDRVLYAPYGMGRIEAEKSVTTTTTSSVNSGNKDSLTEKSASPSAPAQPVSVTSSAASHTVTPPRLRLAVVRPDLLDDWVPELNDANVQAIECRSGEPYWWRCSVCHRTYESSVRARVALGRGCCPHCQGRGTKEEYRGKKETDAREGKKSEENPNFPDSTSFAARTAGASLEGPSLAESHPALAMRWDVERNGLLKPTHVTAESTVSVWWLPPQDDVQGAESDGTERKTLKPRRFKRAVFAFVADPQSVEEKEAAEAALQEGLLARIRVAARIDEAGKQATFPASACHERLAHRVLDTSTRPSQLATSSSSSPPSTKGCWTALQRSDRDAAVGMWKARAARALQEHGTRTTCEKGGSDATRWPHRCFYLSSARLNPVDAAAVVRDDILRAYLGFIRAQQSPAAPVAADTGTATGNATVSGSGQEDSEKAQKPIDRLFSSSSTAAGGIILHPDNWLDAFTLSSADVRPSPSAEADLFFGVLDVSATFASHGGRQRGGGGPASGHVIHTYVAPPSPPSPQAKVAPPSSSARNLSSTIFNLHDEESAVAQVKTFMADTFSRPRDTAAFASRLGASLASYPRRPPPFPPRSREDDVTEATPRTAAILERSTDSPLTGYHRAAPERAGKWQQPSPAAAAEEEEGYVVDGKFHKRPLMWSPEQGPGNRPADFYEDDGVDLELHIRAESTEREPVTAAASAAENGRGKPQDASSVMSPSLSSSSSASSSLLTEAVAALGPVTTLSEEEKRTLQYARDFSRSGRLGLQPRRTTGQRSRSFRLRFPAVDGSVTAGEKADPSSHRNSSPVLRGSNSAKEEKGEVVKEEEEMMASNSAADKTAASTSTFAVPAGPRKVARPRRTTRKQP